MDTLNNNSSLCDTWQAELKVNDKLIKFRLDTGVDAIVLPLDTFNQLLSASLSPSDKVLCGSNHAKLDVAGYFTAVLKWRGKQTTLAVYVLKDVHQPLLGRDAIEALGLIKRLCAVSDNNDPKQQYSDLFTGLGCMAGEYTIRLKPNAQPFALFTPRRVPVNLLSQLKSELDKLESLGVIKRVDEPTPWVALIVVIPKKTSGIRQTAVQTAKLFLKKVDDIYLALLSYRTTPLANGFSPAQLLMGKQLRSTMPTTTASLQPQTPDSSKLQEIDRDIKAWQATSYNARHRARDGKRWQVDDRVWVTVGSHCDRCAALSSISTAHGSKQHHPSQRQVSTSSFTCQKHHYTDGGTTVCLIAGSYYQRTLPRPIHRDTTTTTACDTTIAASPASRGTANDTFR